MALKDSMERMSFTAVLVAAVAIVSVGATTVDRPELLARQAKVETLSPAEKQQLLRNEQRFAALPVAEQDRLRKLAEDLESDPAEARLKQVLARYHEWLKTLTPGQRAELLELPIADRVERIKQIKEQQARHRPRRPPNTEGLSPEDLRKIVRWADDAAWSNREQIIKSLGSGMTEHLAEMSEQDRRRFLALAAWGRLHRGGEDITQLLMADTSKLIEQLSPAAAARLKAAPEAEQRQMLKQWLRAGFVDRMERMGPGRKMPLASNEEIEAFFEKSLSPPERERLLNMPRDEMQRELRRLYVQYSARPEFPPSSRAGKQGGRGKGGRWPGDGPPPDGRRPQRDRDGKPGRKGDPPPDNAPAAEKPAAENLDGSAAEDAKSPTEDAKSPTEDAKSLEEPKPSAAEPAADDSAAPATAADDATPK